MNVADGTYNECNISIGNSGSSSSPITFQSINKWGAKIVSPVGCDVDFNVTGSWIELKFLDISGGGTAGSGTSGGAHGIFLNAGANRLVFNNKIHNLGNIASDTTNAMAGIFDAGGHDIIDSNIIFDVGRTGCVSSCSMHNDHGMYIDGAAGADSPIIKNNLLYHNLVGFQIQLFPGPLNNATIVNNTMDATGTSNDTVGCMVLGSTPLSNSRIANNTCINPNHGVMMHVTQGANSGSNVLIDHNVTTAGAIVESGGSGYTVDGSNIVNANPAAMVNNLGTDYTISPSSPAYGAATGAVAPSVDIIGTPRPQNGRFDAGAYEFTH